MNNTNINFTPFFFSPLQNLEPQYIITEKIIKLHPSLDMNLNYDLHIKMRDYFYHKTIDVWLKNSMKKILDYLKIDNENITISKNKIENKNIDTDEIVNKKIEFIKNNIFTKSTALKILNKYVKNTLTNWYDLPQHQ